MLWSQNISGCTSGCWMSHHSHRPRCLKSSLMLSGQARQPIAQAEPGSPLLVRSRARNPLILFWAERSWIFMASIRSNSSFPTINIHQSSLHGTNEFNMASIWLDDSNVSNCLHSNHRKSSDNGLRLWALGGGRICQVQTGWGALLLSVSISPVQFMFSCCYTIARTNGSSNIY